MSDQNKIEYVFSKPFKFGMKDYSSIDLDIPCAKHIRSLPLDSKKWTGEQIIQLVSSLSNEVPSFVESLPIPELFKIMEVISPFLSDSQEIGN